MNISLSGEDINVKTNTTYIVIDALYLDDIIKYINDNDLEFNDKSIKQDVFYGNEFAYTYIKFAKNKLLIKEIKSFTDSDIKDKKGDGFFSMDSGLLLIIDVNIFDSFIKNYIFGNLVDSLIDVINFDFWEAISKDFSIESTGLILAPGINSEYEFEGSGIYKIIQ